MTVAHGKIIRVQRNWFHTPICFDPAGPISRRRINIGGNY